MKGTNLRESHIPTYLLCAHFLKIIKITRNKDESLDLTLKGSNQSTASSRTSEVNLKSSNPNSSKSNSPIDNFSSPLITSKFDCKFRNPIYQIPRFLNPGCFQREELENPRSKKCQNPRIWT